FRNLLRYLRESVEIRIAYKAEIPVAGIFTLRFKDTVFYKYGCSDTRFNRFGATPWLLWKAIAAAKSNGAANFDFGRTEQGNPGLLEFKNHWVRQPRELVYWKSPGSFSIDSVNRWELRAAKRVFARMPQCMLKLAGRVLYRHIG